MEKLHSARGRTAENGNTKALSTMSLTSRTTEGLYRRVRRRNSTAPYRCRFADVVMSTTIERCMLMRPCLSQRPQQRNHRSVDARPADESTSLSSYAALHMIPDIACLLPNLPARKPGGEQQERHRADPQVERRRRSSCPRCSYTAKKVSTAFHPRTRRVRHQQI